MPHISKQKLDKDESIRIYNNFLRAVKRFEQDRSLGVFYQEFLTPTEKIMFSKRLAAIILLGQGASTYTVWNLLKVSPSTTTRIKLGVEEGKYDHIIQAFQKKQNKFFEFLEELVELLELPPHYVSREEFIRRKFKKHK